MTERFNEYFERTAVLQGNKIALTVDQQSVTYTELLDSMLMIAGALRDIGVASGARVAIYSEMSVHAVASALGTLKAGCVLVCIRHTIPSPELHQQLKDCGASVLIASRNILHRVAPSILANNADKLGNVLSEKIAFFLIDD